MHKETISYTDYNGTERTEDKYFNLNKAELRKWEWSEFRGYHGKLEEMVKSQNINEMMLTFDKIIRMAYGEKSDDGVYFRKKAPDGHMLVDDFMETEAYNVLVDKLFSDVDELIKFLKAIVPEEVLQSMNNADNNATGSNTVQLQDHKKPQQPSNK